MLKMSIPRMALMNQAQTVTGMRGSDIPVLRMSIVVTLKFRVVTSAAAQKSATLRIHSVIPPGRGIRSDSTEGQDCSPEREAVESRKGHFACANLKRKKIVAEARLRRGGEHHEDHERAVKRGERGVTRWRVGKAGQKRNAQRGPDEMKTHQERHGHAEKHAEERQPEIVEPDGFVVGAEDGAGEKTGARRVCVICSAVEGDHGL
jgi:hypothetical protein